ncbi:MAG TPA: hypothetical protein VHY79_17335 [Rhizomicrobium sp.]|jgi:hypothetical protein|nr:hypothetical protein [Rhizomicrobium sp.]
MDGIHHSKTHLIAAGLVTSLAATAPAAAAPFAGDVAATIDPTHDGAHDFDFLIGDWKAHLRRLPDRLVGSNKWIEYDGISNHHKLLDSNANFEQFEVWSADRTQHIKAQTLRLYNPVSHQWSIYLVHLDDGVLDIPPVTGQFTGRRGEFYDQEVWKGRAILVRYVWLDLSPHAARMEQSFSPDGGKSWEVNWICELSRSR